MLWCIVDVVFEDGMNAQISLEEPVRCLEHWSLDWSTEDSPEVILDWVSAQVAIHTSGAVICTYVGEACAQRRFDLNFISDGAGAIMSDSAII